MTFSDFTNQVRNHLLYDANDDSVTEAYISQLVRAWMVELQWLVENYRIDNVSNYDSDSADITKVCESAHLTLPADLYRLKDVNMIRVPECSILVSGAGTAAANVEYDVSEDFVDGKRAYENGSFTVVWSTANARFEIKSGSDVLYANTDDVEFPYLVTSAWTAVTGATPVPTVALADEGCDDTCDKVIPLKPISWTRKNAIERGIEQYAYAVDDDASTMVLNPYPDTDDEYHLQITWDGIKLDYAGVDEVPFGGDCIKVCGDYINWNLALKKSNQAARSDRYEKLYREGLRRLASTQHGKTVTRRPY